MLRVRRVRLLRPFVKKSTGSAERSNLTLLSLLRTKMVAKMTSDYRSGTQMDGRLTRLRLKVPDVNNGVGKKFGPHC